MTKPFVLRLDEKRAARLQTAARKRSVTRSALMREALDKFLAEDKPAKGVGWPARLKELQAQARRIKGHPADEIREIDRNRWK
jgi:hypothetical protein